MRCGRTYATREKKSYPETDESGQFWRSTLLDMHSRLRVACGIAKNETLASVEVFHKLKRRGHPESPPPTISDGWGGIDEAMVAVYGLIREYSGQGRPPTRKQPGKDWQYLQMVKQRDERGKLTGIKLRVVFGSRVEVLQLLGSSTAYIERSNLTSRLFNGRQARKTLAFQRTSKITGQALPGKTPTTTWCVHTRVCACLALMTLTGNGCHAHQHGLRV